MLVQIYHARGGALKSCSVQHHTFGKYSCILNFNRYLYTLTKPKLFIPVELLFGVKI